MLRAWWWLLHALLVSAAALAGWPWPIKLFAVLAALSHGFLRRPPASPGLVLVTEDGSCLVPEWELGPTPLRAGTAVWPFWIRLDLGAGPGRRDILLLGDQVSPDAWRRLRALLARLSCD